LNIIFSIIISPGHNVSQPHILGYNIPEVSLAFGHPRFRNNIIPSYIHDIGYNSVQLGMMEHDNIEPQPSGYITLESVENTQQQTLVSCTCSPEHGQIPRLDCPIHSRLSEYDTAQPSTSAYSTVQQQISSNILIPTLLLNLRPKLM